ncbi:MAG: hypothetical protein MJ179_10875 [Treponema sp.]|nr:hypothetical protein [Treponema sp.]
MKKSKFIFLVLLATVTFAGCKMAPASSEVTIDSISIKVINTPSNTYFAGFWPDGKLNLVQKQDTWQLFWGEADSVRTENSSVWPENHFGSVKAGNVVIGESKPSTVVKGLNENGSWLIGVYPLDSNGKYVGFFHGESHWYTRAEKEKLNTPDAWKAHKSIGVAYSNDYGATWENVSPMIVDSAPKPATPEWSGLGDGCVIWDEENSRWICYYQGRAKKRHGLVVQNMLCMAASYDPEGKPGTWKKWDGDKFTFDAWNPETGLGGANIAIDFLAEVPGANPSVMWNEYLNRWVMVYASWGKEVYISFSDNATDWSRPERILGSSKNPIWYPNLISDQGDKTGGQTVRMYFSYNQDESSGKRDLAYCNLTFK